MAKRRAKRRSTSAKRKRAAQASTASRSARAHAASPKEVDFATEYHYVLGDLKRIAILAAAMFAVLVFLAQIIR